MGEQHPNDSIIQTDSSSWFLTGTTLISNHGVLLARDVTTFIFGNISLQGSGYYQFHNMKIGNGNSLNHVNPANIRISGDLQKDGTFVAGNNTLILNGDSLQNLSGTGSYSFGGLMINNHALAGVALALPAEVTTHLELADGILHTSDTSIFSIADNATSSSGSDSSFVNGPMIKKGDDAFVFPVGKNNKWRRLAISAPQNPVTEFMAEYLDSSYTSVSPVTAPLNSVSNLEHWILKQLTGNSQVTVELFWEDASGSVISNCGDLAVARWDSLSWNHIISTVSGSCTGTDSGAIKTDSVVGNYGAFTFGFYAGVYTQNISICNGDSIQVGSNVYNMSGTYLDVLQDQNQNDSTVITKLTVIIPDTGITISGNMLQSNNPDATSYQWTNCDSGYSILPGDTLPVFTPTMSGNYALIISEDGCIDTSACYQVLLVHQETSSDNHPVSVYPNPFQDEILIEFKEKNIAGRIEIIDLNGRILFSKDVLNESREIIQLNAAPGIYLFRFISGGNTYLTKLVRY